MTNPQNAGKAFARSNNGVPIMSKRIVQAFATIKNQDTLVVIGRTAKPLSSVGLPRGQNWPTLLKTSRLADAAE